MPEIVNVNIWRCLFTSNAQIHLAVFLRVWIPLTLIIFFTDDANSEGGYQVETPTSVVVGGMAAGGTDQQFAIAMEDNPSQQTEQSDG